MHAGYFDRSGGTPGPTMVRGRRTEAAGYAELSPRAGVTGSLGRCLGFLAERADGRLEGDLTHLAGGPADGLRVVAGQEQPALDGRETLLEEPPPHELFVAHQVVTLGQDNVAELLPQLLGRQVLPLRAGDEVLDDVALQLLAESLRVDVADEGGQFGEEAATFDLADELVELVGGDGVAQAEPVGEGGADHVDRARHPRVLPLDHLGQQGGGLVADAAADRRVVDHIESPLHVVVGQAVLGHAPAHLVHLDRTVVRPGDLPNVARRLDAEAGDVLEPCQRVDDGAVQQGEAGQDGDTLVQGRYQRVHELIVGLAYDRHVLQRRVAVVAHQADQRDGGVLDVLGANRGDRCVEQARVGGHDPGRGVYHRLAQDSDRVVVGGAGVRVDRSVGLSGVGGVEGVGATAGATETHLSAPQSVVVTG